MKTITIHKIKHPINGICWVYQLNSDLVCNKLGFSNLILKSYLNSINDYKRNKFLNTALWHDNDIGIVASTIYEWTRAFLKGCDNKICMTSNMSFLPLQLSDMDVLDEMIIDLNDRVEDFDIVLDKLNELNDIEKGNNK